VVLASCSTPQQAAHHDSSTTLPAPTTTLPASIVVGGTQPSGALAFLGSVMRVAVTPVPAGQSAPPPATATSTAGATSTTAPLTAPALPPATVTIGYREFGGGRDLLLVMGQDGTMSWWDPALLSDLSHSYRVTIFDLPGIGYSGTDAAAPTVDRYGDVTAGLIDALGLVHPVVLGWGMGGEVALALAQRHPGLASMLALADASAGGAEGTRPSAAVAAAFADPLTTTAALADYLFPPGDPAELHSWLQVTGVESPDDIVAAGVGTEAAAQAAWWRAGIAPSASSEIKVPLLVLQGSADQVFPPRNESSLAKLLPAAEEITYPGAGYAAIFEEEPLFVSSLKVFTGS
jgi:pimeloyl-ACP methyl ester carboxylesterase